jgi:transposase-like protein
MKKLAEMTSAFKALCQEDQKTFIDELLKILKPYNAESLSSASVLLRCPHCKSLRIRGNGRLRDVQRYCCKSCGKYFSETTGYFHYYLKKPGLLEKYLYCILSGYSVRRAASEVGLSVSTSFAWRVKILTALAGINADRFLGVAESQVLEVSYSEKGKRRAKTEEPIEVGSALLEKVKLGAGIMLLQDRRGSLGMRVISRGRPRKVDLDRVLPYLIAEVEVMCFEPDRSISSFLRNLAIEQRKVSEVGGVARRVFHLKNVSKTICSWNDFMTRFHGVATKYLQNYLNWFMLLEYLKHSTIKMQTLRHIIISAEGAWYRHKRGIYNMDLKT